MRRIFSEAVSGEPGDGNSSKVQPHFRSIVSTLRMRLVPVPGTDVGVFLTRFGLYIVTRFRMAQNAAIKTADVSRNALQTNETSF